MEHIIKIEIIGNSEAETLINRLQNKKDDESLPFLGAIMHGGIGFKKVKYNGAEYLLDLRMISPNQPLDYIDRERYFPSEVKGVLLTINKKTSLTDIKAKKKAIEQYCIRKNITQLPIYIIEIEDGSVISRQEVKAYCEENRLKYLECDEKNKKDIYTVIYCMFRDSIENDILSKNNNKLVLIDETHNNCFIF